MGGASLDLVGGWQYVDFAVVDHRVWAVSCSPYIRLLYYILFIFHNYIDCFFF